MEPQCRVFRALSLSPKTVPPGELGSDAPFKDRDAGLKSHDFDQDETCKSDADARNPGDELDKPIALVTI